MNRIQGAFEDLKAQGKKAYVGYVMAEFPDEYGAFKLAKGLLDKGADILEIGVPFSDPIADGVVIQRCSEAALKNGGGLPKALELARHLRAVCSQPLLLMSYLNPILAHGIEAFASDAAAAGLDGVVLPD